MFYRRGQAATGQLVCCGKGLRWSRGCGHGHGPKIPGAEQCPGRQIGGRDDEGYRLRLGRQQRLDGGPCSGAAQQCCQKPPSPEPKAPQPHKPGTDSEGGDGAGARRGQRKHAPRLGAGASLGRNYPAEEPVPVEEAGAGVPAADPEAGVDEAAEAGAPSDLAGAAGTVLLASRESVR